MVTKVIYTFKFMGKCQSAKNDLTFSRKNGNIKDFSHLKYDFWQYDTP